MISWRAIFSTYLMSYDATKSGFITETGSRSCSLSNRNKCKKSAANELFVILRKQGLQLPKDARTLLKTPRTVEVVEKCGGKYLFMGLESGISKLIYQIQQMNNYITYFI